MKRNVVLVAVVILSGCSSVPKAPVRIFVDSSTHEEGAPKWVRSTKQTWEEDGKLFVRSSHTVRGDDRVDGCYDLAKLDARENVLTEIQSDIRGSLDNSRQSISEGTEEVL